MVFIAGDGCAGKSSTESVLKRPRGRPRSNKEARPPISSGIEDVQKGPSYPLELLTTKFGGMKLALLGYCFEFHFNRKGFKFWKCLNHMNGCVARAVSKNNLVYPLDLNHNHDEDPNLKDALPSSVMASRNMQTTTTTALVSTQTQPTTSTAHNENRPEPTEELKETMKLRLAAIGLAHMKK